MKMSDRHPEGDREHHLTALHRHDGIIIVNQSLLKMFLMIADVQGLPLYHCKLNFDILFLDFIAFDIKKCRAWLCEIKNNKQSLLKC